MHFDPYDENKTVLLSSKVTLNEISITGVHLVQVGDYNHLLTVGDDTLLINCQEPQFPIVVKNLSVPDSNPG